LFSIWLLPSPFFINSTLYQSVLKKLQQVSGFYFGLQLTRWYAPAYSFIEP